MESTDDRTHRQDAVAPDNFEAQRVAVLGRVLVILGVDGVDAAAVARRRATIRGRGVTPAGRSLVVFRTAWVVGNHVAGRTCAPSAGACCAPSAASVTPTTEGRVLGHKASGVGLQGTDSATLWSSVSSRPGAMVADQII